MAAWNIVLGGLQEAHDPDQKHKDMEAVSGVAEVESSPNGGKGRKPLHADRSRRSGPELDRRKGEDRNGANEQPRGPAEEDLGSHGEWFSRLYHAYAWLFRATDVSYEADNFT